MAIINKVDNTASILYDNVSIQSNAVSTLLLLAPTILKTVDKLTAKVGDILTYTVTITNISLSAITDLPFTDIIAVGCTYEADSFTLNGVSATPIITDNTLTFSIPTIAALGTATLQFRTKIIGGEI